MNKQLTAIVLTVLITLSSSMTTLAAREVVDLDGVWITFDSEYYAENNPDVVAQVGTDADALLQHYISSGQYEGRLCCAPMTQVGTTKILTSIYGVDEDYIPATKLLKVVRYSAGGKVLSTEELAYDSKGNLVSCRKILSSGDVFDTIYEYDKYGNLIIEGSGFITTYDGQGNQIRYQANLSSLQYDSPAELIYDNDGKLVEEIRHEGDGRLIYRIKHSYDEEGKLISSVSGYDNKGTDFMEIRRYNDMGKLVYKGQDVGLEALPLPGYDQDMQVGLYYEYSYDELGRLIQINDLTLEYDSRGNMVRRNSTNRGWSEFIYE